jgi:hypothetical protein
VQRASTIADKDIRVRANDTTNSKVFEKPATNKAQVGKDSKPLNEPYKDFL